MRKIIILCFLASLAHILVAQTTPRSGAKALPANSSKTTVTKPRTTLTPKAGLQPSSATRSGTDANATENRSTTNTGRPTTTPKTVPSKMPDAPKLDENEPLAEVEWMTLEEAMEKCKTDKRKIFIDVFTDWCGWCKRMDQSTFVDPAVAQYLNENYYAVKLNAEQSEDITFNNKTYHFKKNGARGYHELAAELLNNRLSFPTVVFLDESMKVIQPISGYLEAPKLEIILNYFGTDSHKTTPWETYERKFSNSQD